MSNKWRTINILDCYRDKVKTIPPCSFDYLEKAVFFLLKSVSLIDSCLSLLIKVKASSLSPCDQIVKIIMIWNTIYEQIRMKETTREKTIQCTHPCDFAQLYVQVTTINNVNLSGRRRESRGYITTINYQWYYGENDKGSHITSHSQSENIWKKFIHYFKVHSRNNN